MKKMDKIRGSLVLMGMGRRLRRKKKKKKELCGKCERLGGEGEMG